MGVSMKKIIIPVVLGFVASSYSLKAEKPLLMNDINPEQLFSKQQIEFEINSIANKQAADLSTLQQEYLKLKQINSVNANSVSDEGLVLLNQYKDYQSQTFIKHEEGPLPLAIFDIASAAKYKLNQYYVHQASLPYLKLRQDGWQDFKLALVSADETSSIQQKAKLAAISDLSAAEYTELAKSLVVSRSYQDPLLVNAIANSKDADLIGSLLQNNHSATAQRVMADKLAEFNSQVQAEILQSVVANNKKLASSALIRYAKLPANARSDQWLTELLSDHRLGASAAKALGITQSQTALETAQAMIKNPSSNRTQVANALLALRFANNDYAKSELVHLLERDQIRFEDMKLEVAKWLD